MKYLTIILLFFSFFSFGQQVFQLEKTKTVDISKMDSIVLEKETASLTIFLQKDQKIETVSNGFIFKTGKSNQDIPAKVFIEDGDINRGTISCNGCAVQNQGDKYSLRLNSTSKEFKIHVSVLNGAGVSHITDVFTFTVAP